MKMVSFVTFNFFLLFISGSGYYAHANNYGILYGENAQDSSKFGSYCATYDDQAKAVPQMKENAEKLLLADKSEEYFCQEINPAPILQGKAVGVARGNCTFTRKAETVQYHGGNMIIVISKTGLDVPGGNSSEEYEEINITISLLENADYLKLKALGRNVNVQLYAPNIPRADYNLLLIWVMAVTTLVVGSLWSGHVRFQQFQRRLKRAIEREQSQNKDVEFREPEEEHETFDVNPKIIGVFVIIMCIMLVSLYFLYDYLVYFIIGLFTIASSTAMYSCLKPMMLRLTCRNNCRIPFSIKWFGQPEIRRIVLAALCISLGVWWAVVRNQSYAWILQNILGIAFCINMMKTVRLPNFKACTILLCLLFFYDIFFVFITPLFTKSGHSVMVDVATGGSSSSGEMLPLVLKVPKFASSTLSVCSLPYSLLGYGDILVPGLLASYCCSIDFKLKTRKFYLIITSVAYGIGLLITFLALALMNSGQPALLYLVPCTLLTVTIGGKIRGDLRTLWTGELDNSKQNKEDNVQEQTSDGAVQADARSGPASLDITSSETVNTNNCNKKCDKQLLIKKE